jgi:hypothetical protein
MGGIYLVNGLFDDLVLVGDDDKKRKTLFISQQ